MWPDEHVGEARDEILKLYPKWEEDDSVFSGDSADDEDLMRALAEGDDREELRDLHALCIDEAELLELDMWDL